MGPPSKLSFSRRRGGGGRGIKREVDRLRNIVYSRKRQTSLQRRVSFWRGDIPVSGDETSDELLRFHDHFNCDNEKFGSRFDWQKSHSTSILLANDNRPAVYPALSQRLQRVTLSPCPLPSSIFQDFPFHYFKCISNVFQKFDLESSTISNINKKLESFYHDSQFLFQDQSFLNSDGEKF